MRASGNAANTASTTVRLDWTSPSTRVLTTCRRNCGSDAAAEKLLSVPGKGTNVWMLSVPLYLKIWPLERKALTIARNIGPRKTRTMASLSTRVPRCAPARPVEDMSVLPSGAQQEQFDSGHHDEQRDQYQRHGVGKALVEEHECLLVDVVGGNVGRALGAAPGEDEDRSEQLKGSDGGGHHSQLGGALQEREDHEPDQLPPGAAVDPRC